MSELRDRYLSHSLSEITDQIAPFTQVEEIGYSTQQLQQIHAQASNGGIPKEDAQSAFDVIQDVITQTSAQLGMGNNEQLWGQFSALFSTVKQIKERLAIIEVIESVAEENPLPSSKEIEKRIQEETEISGAGLRAIMQELVISTDAPKARGNIHRLIALCQNIIEHHEKLDDQQSMNNKTTNTLEIEKDELAALIIEFKTTPNKEAAQKIIQIMHPIIKSVSGSYNVYGDDVVEDFYQQTCMHILNKIKSIPEKTLQSSEECKYYLSRTIKNACINYARADERLRINNLTQDWRVHKKRYEKAKQELFSENSELDRLSIAKRIETNLCKKLNSEPMNLDEIAHIENIKDAENEYEKHMIALYKKANLMIKHNHYPVTNIEEAMDEARIKFIEEIELRDRPREISGNKKLGDDDSSKELFDAISSSSTQVKDDEGAKTKLKEMQKLVLEFIEDLKADKSINISNKHISIFVAVCMYGMSYEETAEYLDIPRPTVGTGLMRIRRKIEEHPKFKQLQSDILEVYRNEN